MWGSFLVFALLRVFELRGLGQLYFGGTNNLWSDTLRSLVHGTYYWVDYPSWALLGSMVAIASMIGVLTTIRIMRWLQERSLTTPDYLLLILLFTVAAPVAQHLLFGALYPLGRAALIYLPLMVIASAFVADELRHRLVTPIATLALLASIGHFLVTANLSHSYQWLHDSHSKQVVAMIEAEYAEEKALGGYDGQSADLRIGINWLSEPSMNYYRRRHGLEWMTPLTRKGPLGEYDYYYVSLQERDGLPDSHELIELASFKDSSTVLLRRPGLGAGVK